MDHDLQPGDHLVSRRRWYIHHGIYAGNGRVIHYRGYTKQLKREPVEEVSIERFAGRHGFEVKDWAARQYTGESCVARARMRIGERRYRLLSNNCEHFCEWCITGQPHSAQVEQWLAWAKGEVNALLAKVWPRTAHTAH